jgi:hypothetical protein
LFKEFKKNENPSISIIKNEDIKTPMVVGKQNQNPN